MICKAPWGQCKSWFYRGAMVGIYIFISSKRQPNIIINTLKTLKY